MVYLDTSFIAPLAIAEETSDSVETFVMTLLPGDLATSLWTRVELASLISRKRRMGELSDTQAEAVRRELARLLEESFLLLVPTTADFALAARYLETPASGLRAGDALHLAIAAGQGAETILTLDAGFIRAGRLLHLPVARGIMP
ncbi:type II toxin-antitoxin system VapC family toxin [Thiocapsa sp.]|uniref:type II toxin-antitoxin system VapC family toxin n=1 Tax=Thiocapsa sp. TaxID=2024551 RepID=UPI0025DC2DC8|nr:type II toxin-antitoxin system VapC family toxin [Thiocapsa sp.]